MNNTKDTLTPTSVAVRVSFLFRIDIRITKPPYRKSFHAEVYAFIFQTNRCMSLSGLVSVPPHHPSCGKAVASARGYGTHGSYSSPYERVVFILYRKLFPITRTAITSSNKLIFYSRFIAGNAGIRHNMTHAPFCFQ